MKREDAFPSKWLKAEHLKEAPGRKLVLTISGVTTVKYRDGSTSRALSFDETDKQLGLNKTNWEACEQITGRDDDEKWAGHKVEAFFTMVEFGGKQVPGIRLRPVGGWENLGKEAPPEAEEDLPF